MRSAGFYTLGCKVSQYETEAIAELFEKKGFEIKPFSEKCDVYVINTCTVTAEADRKSRQIIRRAKKINPEAKVIVCGCYSQRSENEVLAITDVDGVVGSAHKCEIPDMAQRLLSGGARENLVTDIDKEPFEPMRISRGPRTRVYVKIEDGCEAKCAYCAIPSARGKVRSKPKKDVIEEVLALFESGVAEVVLTGIETGSYGRDFEEKYTLADLICELDGLAPGKRIRLGSLAPELSGEEFCRKLSGVKILAPHFHLSLQSGSDKVLGLMRRRYTRAIALKNIERLREVFADATFTTDIMVGFPGESEEDFLESVSFVREARFIDTHIFAYSERKNTPAVSFPNKVSEEEKRRRSEILIAVSKEVSTEVLSDIVAKGEPLRCIFEQKRGGLWIGHSEGFAEVRAECSSDIKGKELLFYPEKVADKAIYGKII